MKQGGTGEARQHAYKRQKGEKLRIRLQREERRISGNEKKELSESRNEGREENGFDRCRKKRLGRCMAGNKHVHKQCIKLSRRKYKIRKKGKWFEYVRKRGTGKTRQEV